MTTLMYTSKEEELVNRVKQLRRFFNQKIRPMPQQSLLAMRVAFGVRAQYATIGLLATILVTQLIGVVIFSGNSKAAGAITYNRSIASVQPAEITSLTRNADNNGTLYFLADSANHKIQVYAYPNLYPGPASTLFSFYTLQPYGFGLFSFLDDGGNQWKDCGSYCLEYGTAGSGNGQFSASSKLNIAHASSFVYVVDAGNSRIQKIDTYSGYSTKWGTAGSGNGQFSFANNTGAVAVASGGNVYVADTGNHRIQVFNSSGTYISQWGSSGTGTGQFTTINDIDIDSSGNVYVSEGDGITASNSRVQKFNSSGTYLLSFGNGNGGGGGNFVVPGGIDINGANDVYVADLQDDRVQIFNSAGVYQSQYVSGSSIPTKDVAIDEMPSAGSEIDDSGDLFTIDAAGSAATDSEYVKRVNSAGDTVDSFAGSQQAVLNRPVAVALSPSKVYLYTVSRANNRIQKYFSGANQDGVNVANLSWGGQGSADGQFDSPTGIATDPSGNVYVVDSGNNRIQKFDQDGTYITKWGTSGSGNGQFSQAKGIATDPSGNVYVVDSGNDRIQKFDSVGTYITKWGTSGSGNGQFMTADAITVDPAGRIFVLDTGRSDVQKFAADGTFIAKWGSSGSGNGQFNFSDTPSGNTAGIVVGDLGFGYSIYVTDASNDRVQVFTDSSLDIRLEVTTMPVSAVAQTTATLALQTNDNANAAAADHTIEYGTTVGYGDETSIESTALAQAGNLGSAGVGSSNGQVSGSHNSTVDSHNNTFIIDGGNCRIQKFDSQGVYQSQFGSCGTGAGQFSTHPFGIALDSNDNIYVADWSDSYVNRVQKFDSSGAFLLEFVANVGAGCPLYKPGGLVVDSSDTIYVADFSANKIEKFDTSGTCITGWDAGVDSFGRIAIDASDNIYIIAVTSGIVYKYSSIGDYISEFGSPGTGSGEFSTPFAITVDHNGTIYVGDSGGGAGNNRIQLFDANGTYKDQISVPLGSGVNILSGLGVQTDGTIVATMYQGAGATAYAGTLWKRTASFDITGLTCGTTYHYRAKAAVDAELVLGGDQTFTTDACDFVLAITTTSLPNGTVGSAYSQTISTNAVSPVSLAVLSGSLPPGLSLAGDGSLTGTPTTAGTYNFTARATSGPDTDDQALTIIVEQDLSFQITTGSLPSGLVGTAYSQTVQTDSPIAAALSIVGGSLPSGLSMDGDGLISGTPTAADTYNFTVQADNGSYSTTRALSIIITTGAVIDPIIEPPGTPTEPTDPDEQPSVTDVTPAASVATRPTKTSPVAGPQVVVAVQNNLFALAKRIPEPVAIGFPWLLLLLALVLIAIQYYQVHAESAATRRIQAVLANQERLVDEQNNFVALSTHYLHTPLTVMEGEITLMVKAGTLSESQATKLKATLASLGSEAEAVLAQEEQDELNR